MHLQTVQLMLLGIRNWLHHFSGHETRGERESKWTWHVVSCVRCLSGSIVTYADKGYSFRVLVSHVHVHRVLIQIATSIVAFPTSPMLVYLFIYIYHMHTKCPHISAMSATLSATWTTKCVWMLPNLSISLSLSLSVCKFLLRCPTSMRVIGSHGEWPATPLSQDEIQYVIWVSLRWAWNTSFLTLQRQP